jgi:preprotein translocase subunit SecA
VRYLYFLQVTQNAPVLPFPEEGEEEGGEEESSNGSAGQAAASSAAAAEAQRQAAKSTMEDFTRNIQRKKERELQVLQFGGGDDSSGPKTVNGGQKVGRNDPCPCGSGKKYKKCHGA